MNDRIKGLSRAMPFNSQLGNFQPIWGAQRGEKSPDKRSDYGETNVIVESKWMGQLQRDSARNAMARPRLSLLYEKTEQQAFPDYASIEDV